MSQLRKGPSHSAAQWSVCVWSGEHTKWGQYNPKMWPNRLILLTVNETKGFPALQTSGLH